MKMFYRSASIVVEVYQFFENKTALIFNPNTASAQNGHGGLVYVPLKSLIPLEYYNENKENFFMSKTERNKIKERLTLTKAEWTCSDGTVFESCDEAIKHESEIMNNAKQE